MFVWLFCKAWSYTMDTSVSYDTVLLHIHAWAVWCTHVHFAHYSLDEWGKDEIEVTWIFSILVAQSISFSRVVAHLIVWALSCVFLSLTGWELIVSCWSCFCCDTQPGCPSHVLHVLRLSFPFQSHRGHLQQKDAVQLRHPGRAVMHSPHSIVLQGCFINNCASVLFACLCWDMTTRPTETWGERLNFYFK